jgi:hypothetical protein
MQERQQLHWQQYSSMKIIFNTRDSKSNIAKKYKK